MDWHEIEKKLELFCDSHNIDEKNKKEFLHSYRFGLENPSQIGRMTRCIDWAIGWADSKKGYEFYYFLQLRWLNFLAKFGPKNNIRYILTDYGNVISFAKQPNYIEEGRTLAGLKKEYPERVLINEKDFHRMRNYHIKSLAKLRELNNIY